MDLLKIVGLRFSIIVSILGLLLFAAACEETPTPLPTATPETTTSLVPRATPETTPTPLPTATPEPTPTATSEPTPTTALTPTPLSTPTPLTTSEPTPTTALTPTPVSTPTPLTPEPTPTTALTPTPASTPTPLTPEPTPTPVSTPTPLTATPEPTPTPTPVSTPTPLPTSTREPTPTARESAVAYFAGSIPWFGSPPFYSRTPAANLLIQLWLRDADLGKLVAEIPWLKDGITRDEYTALLMLTAVPPEAARLTVSVYGLPWLADGVWVSSQSSESQSKRIAVDTLRTMSYIDGQSVALLLSFPWIVADDISDDQISAITLVLEMLQEFPTVAKEVLGFPWVRDDITQTEVFALGSIRDIARSDLDLAWHVLKSPFMEPPLLQRDAYALVALDLIAISGPPRGIDVSGVSGSDTDLGSGVRVGIYTGSSELLAQLAGQPWFSDGLDDDDAALLHGIAHSQGDFRQALIETNYVESASIDLPLTGEMGLAVVRHTPFPPDDQTLKRLEEGVRIMEDFMGAPLSAGDVTLLLVEPEFWTSRARADLVGFTQSGGPSRPAYFRGIVRAVNPETGPPTRSLYHELGHYYGGGPRWLREGLANFLEAYIVARTGGEGLEERLAYLGVLRKMR